MEMFRTETSEVDGEVLELTEENPALLGLPSWLRGSFYVAGPHGTELGPQHMDNYLDGFGRVLAFDLLEEKRVKFTARMMLSKFYNESLAMGERVPSILFEETTPPQNFSFFKQVTGPADNGYVQQLAFAGELWGTTDTAQSLRYSPDLRCWHSVEWQDSLPMSLHQVAQVAHAVVETSGRMVGLMTQTAFLKPINKDYFTLYAIDPDEPYTRKNLATFEVPVAPYQHSFGLGSGIAVVGAHPWVIDAKSLMGGGEALQAMDVGFGPGVQDSARQPQGVNTTFYLANFESKEVESFTADPYLFFHFTNVVEQENGDVVFCLPSFTGNAYQVYSTKKLASKGWRDAIPERVSNSLRRFTLHRSGPLKGTATSELVMDGWFEFPQFNTDWRGRATKYLYAVEWFYGGSDAFADMALVKLDLQAGKQAAVYHVPGHYPGEPKFVARPGASDEDDGVVISVIFDSLKKTSYLLVLDGQSFEPIARFDLGLRVPTTVHGTFRFAHDVA